MEKISSYIEYAALAIEIVGILIIIIGIGISICKFIIARQSDSTERSYSILRKELGKSILLGLEVLVAADIIGTVVTEPTLQKVIILGVIVLIRTFLSLSIQVEIEGRFPWQRINKEENI